ncbi:MAG: tyrosine-type recombinase/integrase [Fibromonadaceae bacterium]|jgi:integrase|nr:tyrosine-type recombinase/integrase [Fibromonadaceae bacterium]
MASLDIKRGLIRDRSNNYPEVSYYIPKTSMKFMRECLKGHNMITLLLGKNKLPKKELKAYAIRYASLDNYGKTELIKKLVMLDISKNPNDVTLASIADSWLERKSIENPIRKTSFKYHRDIIMKFFDSEKLTTTADLNYDTAIKYIKWRTVSNFNAHSSNPLSASTIKHELQTLRQMARLAAREGHLQNGGIWDDVTVKAVAGVNKKVVEPLTIEEQKELLSKMESMPSHDIALLLLITGIRIGELDALSKDSLNNGMLTLHGEGVGRYKPIGGKTVASSRTLPVCPTLAKLFERGNIFKSSPNSLKIALKRNFKGIHAHRLRHTFAVNKLLAQTPLQMVSYQMGHSETGITADLYGKFVPEHFKAGFEETIRIRKEHLDWLENHYFLI